MFLCPKISIFNINLGLIVFGILDCIWSALKLIVAINYATNLEWALGTTDASYLTLETVSNIIEAVLNAVFAVFLLYGASAKKWRFLVAFCFWQVPFNVC